MIICSCLTSKISNYPSSLSKPKGKMLSLLHTHKICCHLTVPYLPPPPPLGLPSIAAWSGFSALSFSLSFHYESVFYSVLICYFTKSMWVFIVFCTTAPVWFYLLIFFAEFLNLGPCVWLCVGAVVLRTVLWTSDICCWVTQLEFWVSKVWLCVWLCVGLWG